MRRILREEIMLDRFTIAFFVKFNRASSTVIFNLATLFFETNLF